MPDENEKTFRDRLAHSKGANLSDIDSVFGIESDYTSEVPFVQYPVPGPKGSPRQVAIRFSEPISSSTVGNDTVMMVLDGDRAPIDADVSMSDDRTVFIQPAEKISEIGNRGELVHIIVTPGVSMADGRPFAGLSFSTVLA